MSNLQKQLFELQRDAGFSELRRVQQRLNIFRVLGLQHDELSHSRILSALLRKEDNPSGATLFLAALLRQAATAVEKHRGRPP